MKLHTEKRDVTRSGELVESQFKIKATAKAFGILSSGLYSDKILAIVRELACNAYDAHVMAGKRDVPIEIKLPTTLDPTFYVKDCGIGLDHEGVTELYTTYFESTKCDSDDQIGALGLGSKSPFSYVSTFNVEARHNGVKRLYTAFINEDGVPSISKLGQEKTSEENGLTVSLATKTSDGEKFKAAAMKALMYFDVLPNVIGGGTGFRPYNLKHTVEGTGWKLREADYYAHMEGAYVVQGMVAYPIDDDILSQHGLSDIGKMILEQNVDLFVKIGAVEVAASREALSYTKKTIENLIKIVDDATKEMRASIQTEIDKMPSRWDACLLHATYDSYHHKMHKLYSQLHSQKAFLYKNKKVTDAFELDMIDVKQTILCVTHTSRYNRGNKTKVRTGGLWQPGAGPVAFTFTVQPGMKVLVDDVSGGKALLQVYFSDDKNLTKNDDTYLLVLKGLGKKLYDQAEVNKILNMLGINDAVYGSKLSYTVVKQKYNYRARKSNEALVWCGFPANGGYRRNQVRRVFSRLCWNGTKVDLHKDSGFYVPLERFAIMRRGHEATHFDVLLSAMYGLGIVDKNVKVLGLNEKQVPLIKKNNNWQNVFDYADEQFAKLNTKNELTNKMVGMKLSAMLGEGVLKSIVGNWSSIEPKLVDGSFKTIFSTIAEYTRAVKSCKFSALEIEAGANATTGNSAFFKKINDDFDGLQTKFEAVMAKHAMLGLVDWQKVSAKSVDMIVEYVNFVAKA